MVEGTPQKLPGNIFDYSDRFNAGEEETERESTPPPGTNKVLPVGEPFSAIVELNVRIIAQDQALEEVGTVALDMDNN